MVYHVNIFHTASAVLFFCTSQSFYLYGWRELPEYRSFDVYPPPGAKLHEESGYNYDFYANNGAGQLMSPEVGLFQTWQSSLFKNVMARLYISEFLTRDPSKASSFIIPFDLGVHSYIDHQNGRPRLAPHTAGFFTRLVNTCAHWRRIEPSGRTEDMTISCSSESWRIK